MSLAIDVDCVTHVLLVDGWREVAAKSFTMAPYECGHRNCCVDRWVAPGKIGR
jgi:hypothetical protein